MELNSTEFKELVNSLYESNENLKELDKTVSIAKEEVKKVLIESNTDKFMDNDTGVSITISRVDKSTLDLEKTLTYLKNNKLTKFIKTKEYFDLAEVTMALQRDEIPSADIAPFVIQKEEIRLNIKQKKF